MELLAGKLCDSWHKYFMKGLGLVRLYGLEWQEYVFTRVGFKYKIHHV